MAQTPASRRAVASGGFRCRRAASASPSAGAARRACPEPARGGQESGRGVALVSFGAEKALNGWQLRNPLCFLTQVTVAALDSVVQESQCFLLGQEGEWHWCQRVASEVELQALDHCLPLPGGLVLFFLRLLVPRFPCSCLLSHIFMFFAFISFLLSGQPELQAWSLSGACSFAAAEPARPALCQESGLRESSECQPGARRTASGLRLRCHTLRSQALWEAGSASAVRLVFLLYSSSSEL